MMNIARTLCIRVGFSEFSAHAWNNVLDDVVIHIND
jgi:hypothetical protein